MYDSIARNPILADELEKEDVDSINTSAVQVRLRKWHQNEHLKGRVDLALALRECDATGALSTIVAHASLLFTQIGRSAIDQPLLETGIDNAKVLQSVCNDLEMEGQSLLMDEVVHRMISMRKIADLRVKILSAHTPKPLVRSRRRNMKMSPECLIAHELVEWFVKNRHAPDKEKAVELGRKLVQFGGMIPLQGQANTTFDADSTMYVFLKIKKGTHNVDELTLKMDKPQTFKGSGVFEVYECGSSNGNSGISSGTSSDGGKGSAAGSPLDTTHVGEPTRIYLACWEDRIEWTAVMDKFDSRMSLSVKSLQINEEQRERESGVIGGLSESSPNKRLASGEVMLRKGMEVSVAVYSALENSFVLCVESYRFVCQCKSQQNCFDWIQFLGMYLFPFSK